MGARTSSWHIVLGVSLACWAILARADAAEDFEAGDKAYLRGDVVTAMEKMRKAADAGHAKAQARLGYILDKSEFDDEAVKYYRRSAEQGEPEGEFGLGSMYVAGEGVTKDMVEARKWLVLAADKGYYPAVQVLAGAYIKGDLKLEEGQAAQVSAWLRMAADNGFLPAIDAVARAFKSGDFGFSPDPALAAQYEAKADTIRGIAKQKSKERKK